MATSFASRLSNLRTKKESNNEDEQGELKLSLPNDTSEKSSYEPTAISNNPRTSMRLLKGRIDRGQSSEKSQTVSNTLIGGSYNKLSLNDEPKSELKLVINDDPVFEEKKTSVHQPPKVPIQKRILIAKEPPKEEIKKEQPPKKQEPRRQEVVQSKIQNKEEQKVGNLHQQTHIKQEQVEESTPQNQNDLVMCPQGCGRKFNRKALEKHAKACKIVFMSKRKQFNSEAKRITSKEQANIVKQTKLKEKKEMGMTRGKGFDKTGDNWKAASQDFRSAIRGMKKEDGEGNDEEKKEEVVVVVCEYCEKQFNEVFMDKHLQNCIKKKEKEQQLKKKTSKK